MFLAIFLLEAAGKISSELISNIPIHLIEIITITAISTTNILSIFFTLIPLLLAKVLLMLMTFSLLNVKYQNAYTKIAAKNTYNIIS